MASWQVSPVLVPLIAEVKRKYPRIVVGTIGDPKHQSEVSDHNPDKNGDVCAADFMIGPHFTKADAVALFNRLIVLRDPRFHYEILDRHIVSATTLPYRVRVYDGSDPHTGHIHVSVLHAQRPTTSWQVYPPAKDDDMEPGDVWNDVAWGKANRETAGDKLVYVDETVEKLATQMNAMAADIAAIKAAVLKSA